MSTVIESLKDRQERENVVANNPKIIASGTPLPDGKYEMKISNTGTFDTRSGSTLMCWQGTVTDHEGKAHEFTNDKFLVVTDSLSWRSVDPGSVVGIEVGQRRIRAIDLNPETEESES